MTDLGDLCRIEARMSMHGSLIMNVYHAAPTAFVSNVDTLADLADRVDSAHAEVNDHISAVLQYVDIRVINLTANAEVGIMAWPTLIAGVDSANALPPGVAALATFPTITPKRRGRKFLAGFSESTTTNLNEFDAASMGSLASYAAKVATNFLGANSGVLWRFVVPASGTLLFASISGAILSDIPAYQRRRKQGVGL